MSDCKKCEDNIPVISWLKKLPTELCSNAIYFVKSGTDIEMYVTNYQGVPSQIGSASGGGDIEITSPNNTITIEQDGQIFELEVSSSLVSIINSALQAGDDISLLNNDAGYITLADISTFNPSDYDLEDFTNISADTFVRQSDLMAVSLQQAYNNSTAPEILTNATLGAVTIRRGSLSNTDNVLEIENGSGTLTASINANGEVTSNSETASRLASFDANKKIKSLDTETYPSLTEISYVKGVTSGIQTQLNGKQNTLTFDATPTDGSTNPVESNGVFDALALKANSSELVYSNMYLINMSVGGTSSEIYVTSLLLPPISGAVGKRMVIKLAYSKVGTTSGNVNPCLYVGTVGGGIVGSKIFTGRLSGTNKFTINSRNYEIKSGALRGSSPTTALTADEVETGTIVFTDIPSIDLSVTNYINVTSTSSFAGETTTFEYLSINIFR